MSPGLKTYRLRLDYTFLAADDVEARGLATRIAHPTAAPLVGWATNAVSLHEIKDNEPPRKVRR